MLKVLVEYFKAVNLPFFWAPQYNLLDILRRDEIEHYRDVLVIAYNILLTYPEQKNLSFSTCCKHFSVSNLICKASLEFIHIILDKMN